MQQHTHSSTQNKLIAVNVPQKNCCFNLSHAPELKKSHGDGRVLTGTGLDGWESLGTDLHVEWSVCDGRCAVQLESILCRRLYPDE